MRSRPLVLVCGALVAAAALLWGASSTGIALLALAGVAGVVATGGVVRRAVGGLLGLAGVAAAVAASWLAVAGGAVLLVAGAFVLVREPLLPRYGAGGDRRAEVDPDRAAWQELDAGRDPTADAPPGRNDPAGGPPNRAG